MSKDKIINFKVEEGVKTEFEALCSDSFTTPSQELYKFVRNYIKRNRGSKILLSDLKHNRNQ